MPRERRFKLTVVGGPYDGLRGLYWSDMEGDLVPPDVIFIGQCPGDGTCYGSVAHCHAQGGGRAHPSYWTPVEGEDARPPECLRYQRSAVDEETLTATYVRGNMAAVGEWRDEIEAELPDLVTAAADARRTQPYFDTALDRFFGPGGYVPFGSC